MLQSIILEEIDKIYQNVSLAFCVENHLINLRCRNLDFAKTDLNCMKPRNLQTTLVTFAVTAPVFTACALHGRISMVTSQVSKKKGR